MSEHPFAQYIRILGKGKRGSRSLSQQEACQSMKMILDDEVEACQLGAFLMLLRVKEETPAEIAGFVEAVKNTFNLPENPPEISLDWSSYAGKRRQLPWFILAALLLAENHLSVFMHGAEGHTANRIYTRDVLTRLGIPVSQSLEQAAAQIRQTNFAYLPLAFLSPTLHHIIQMRPLLGLRSPVHTIARLLNPFNSAHEIQGIFHPGYRNIHQQAAQLLNQPHIAVLKGEGGEAERNPDQKTLVKSVHLGKCCEEEWPALFNGPRHLKDETMNPSRLIHVWRGEDKDEYAIASITGTVAIALKLLGIADSIPAAQLLAKQFWDARKKEKFS
ncbi:MAG TPA: glycosyl transferase family protein [Gammaproteobacteria bacterium]|nr:glycosyl transferase family protein [Gammaproteobacteria bacterium]